jgi:hypothetical protein
VSARKSAAALRVIPEEDGGLTLEDLFSDVITFEMTVKGKRLEVSWAPARYTPILEESSVALSNLVPNVEEDEDLTPEEREQRVAEAIRAEGRAVRQFLAGVLVSWTLHRADGSEVPTDEDTLRSLPSPFLKEVFEALTGTAGPKDVTEPPSAPTSSPTA